MQVSLDAEGEVEVIDADLRERLGMFAKVEGFREARLFEGSGGAYELVIRYEEAGRLLRERRALSGEEVRALRERVSRRLARSRARPGDRAQLEGGRYRFLTATTLLGAAEVPLFVTAAGAAEDDEGETLLAATLLGATGGFFVPLLLTREASVTEAEATLTGYGGLQGLGHGLALSTLATGDDLSERGTAAAAALLGAAEATAGFLFARRRGMRGGTAETMAISGLYGAGLGLGLSTLVVGDGSNSAEAAERRVYALGGLAGSALGAYGGYRLGRAADYTQGDARIFGTAGLVGAQLANTVLLAADGTFDEEARVTAGTIMAGALGGLALGHRLVRRRDFTEGQGNIISLGAYAGSLAGGGASIIVDASAETASVLGALGALGGFLGTYLAYEGEAQPGPSRLDWNVGVRPGGRGGPLGRLTPALDVRLSF